MRISKSFLSLVSLVALVACGGGGDDGPSTYYTGLIYPDPKLNPSGRPIHECTRTFDTRADCQAAEQQCRASYPNPPISTSAYYTCICTTSTQGGCN